MKKEAFNAIVIASIIVVLCISVAPVMAWTYDDCTSDEKYEKFGPRTDNLLFIMYADAPAEYAGLEAGEIDMIEWAITKDLVDKWTAPPWNETIKVVSYGAELGYFIIDINCLPTYPGDYERGAKGEDNPTRVPCFRHALWHLMNRTHVVEEIYKGLAVPIYTPVPPSLPAYQHPDIIPGGAMEVLTHPYDCEYAKQILDNCDQDPEDGMPDFPVNPDTGWRFWDKNGNGVEDPDEYLELWFYIRIDDPLRNAMGDYFADEIEDCLQVRVNRRYKDVYGCWFSVMLEHEFNLYTGGWSLSADPDHLVLYHSDYYWYPGFCYNYGGMNCSTYDYWVDKLLEAPTWDELKDACLQAQVIFNSPLEPEDGHSCDCPGGAMGCIPVLSFQGYKAYRRRYTGGTNEEPVTPDDGENKYRGLTWQGIVNVPAMGPDPTGMGYSMLNMHPYCHPVGDCEHMTIRVGFKLDELEKPGNPVYAEWLWDNVVWGLCHESLLARDPYTWEWMPWLAKDYELFTWTDPVTGEEKVGVRLHLRPNVYWSDGEPVTAADVMYTLIEMDDELMDIGLPPPWWYSNVVYIKSMYIIDPLNIEILLDTRSVLAVGWVGGTAIFPKHIWKHLIELAAEGKIDLTIPAPDPNMVGAGAFRFVEYNPEAYYCKLVANKPGLTIEPVWPEGYWDEDYPPVPTTNPYGYFRYNPVYINVHAVSPESYLTRFNLPHDPGKPPTVTSLPIEIEITLKNLWLNQCSGGKLIVNKYVYYSDPSVSTWCGPGELVLLPGYPIDVTLETLPNGTIIPDTETINIEIPAGSAACGNPAWIKVAVHIKGPEMLDPEHPNPWICRWINFTLPIAVTIAEDTAGQFYCGNEQIPAPDFKVDLYDVYRAAMAFASYPGHPAWDSVHDITGDYQVDLADYYRICQMFGWEAPAP